MWRSKPSAAPTWQRRLKKDSWMTHLSTRILKPSQQKSFEEKYTASLEDIPVSRSVARESDKERKTQDTCGHTSEAMSGQLDLFGAFSKMSEVTPRWGYGESCPIWKKMVTERSSDCTQRRKQARLTNASDASSWGTPKEQDSRAASWDRGKSNLGEQVHGMSQERWLTPTTTDIVRSPEGMEKRKQYRESIGRKYLEGCLSEQVDNQLASPPAPEKSSTSGKNQGSWPTPNTSDQYNPNIPHDIGRSYLRTESLPEDQRKPKPTMKLNPNWVEQLMGLPIGWTDLGSWGTELSPKPQN